MNSPLNRQVGGTHYQTHGIQLIEFIERNGFPFSLGCAIKYVARWRLKGGVQDLEKAIHYLEFAEEFGTEWKPKAIGVPFADFIRSNSIPDQEEAILNMIWYGWYLDAIASLKALVAGQAEVW